MENIELQHHGVTGQKWGIRRFQNKDGSLTAEGKRRYGIIGTLKERSAAKKKQKQREAALEKARETKRTKAEEAAEKKRVLESGTASEVLKYKGQLTNKELADAFNRLNYEKLISDISAKDAQANSAKTADLLSRTESTVNKIQRGVDTAQKGLDTYNKAAKVVNALTKADLPTFEGNKKTKAAESAMEKLLKSGTAEQIEKQFGKLTSKQLQDVNVRFTNEDKIKERAANERAAREADKKAAESKAEKATGTVEGEGTSRSKMKNDTGFEKKQKSADYYDPIDSRFVNDTPMSEVRKSEQARIGHDYVNELFLLEDKSR